MKCPVCHLENPEAAAQCDCGYTLTGSKLDPNYHLRSIAESVQTIRRVVVCWAVLTIVGMIAWLAVATLSWHPAPEPVRAFQEK